MVTRTATLTALLTLLLAAAGCTQHTATLTDAFPPAGVASPWILSGEVWNGSFEEAAPALGDDAETWRAHNPAGVWIAKYCLERRDDLCLTIRGFSFETADDARQAYDAFRPPDARPFGEDGESWDAGCWTEIGVLFQWGRLVFDVFGVGASLGDELQSAMLAAHLAKRMPAGIPDDPR